ETAPADDAVFVPYAQAMMSAPDKQLPCETSEKSPCVVAAAREGATNDDKTAYMPQHRFYRGAYIIDNLASSDGKPVEPLLFRSGYVDGDPSPGAYGGEAPLSTVTDIEWRNTWTNRQQWLVLVRDHFLARLRTQSLTPSYPLPDFGKLVYC